MVTLIHFTGKGSPQESWEAAHLLLFTKSTRLTLSPGLLDEIRSWPKERKLEELTYMANTIPSSWEFVDYTFLVTGVSRAYTHQQVRTRSGSYAQQSMRIVDAGDFDYVYTSRNLADDSALAVIDSCMNVVKLAYAELRAMGQSTEDARGVLPTNIATNIICKFNLRTFAELARSRSGGRTQAEYQSVVAGMIDAVLEVHPWVAAFLFGKLGRDYFEEIEAFAEETFGGDLAAKGRLLKIVDHMRKGQP